MFESEQEKRIKRYHEAVRKMQKAEEKYSAALDELSKAKAERRANDVPGLRRKASEAEDELKAVLESANRIWGSYWHERRSEFAEQLKAVGPAIKHYDAISHVLGEFVASPSFTFLQARNVEKPMIRKESLLDDSGVPVESPDSEVLESRMGVWRL